MTVTIEIFGRNLTSMNAVNIENMQGKIALLRRTSIMTVTIVLPQCILARVTPLQSRFSIFRVTFQRKKVLSYSR